MDMITTGPCFTNRCYFLIGPTACGKTYWRKSATKRWRNGILPCEISLDYVDDDGEAELALMHQFYAAIGVRHDIIIDLFNLGYNDRKKFLDFLPDDYEKVAIVFTLSKPLHLERLQLRNDDPVNNNLYVSQKALETMMHKYQKPRNGEFHRITFIDDRCVY